MNRNIGIATAYGYALSKGYTGTEEEFAELMAGLPEAAAKLSALEMMAYRHETRLSAAEDAIPVIQAAIPNAASVSNSGLLSVSHGETLLFSVQLPLYGGGTE